MESSGRSNKRSQRLAFRIAVACTLFKTTDMENRDIEIVDGLDPAEFEWEAIDGIKEAAFILKCIQATFPNGDPCFDEIDRGKMTKVLMKHIRQL